MTHIPITLQNDMRRVVGWFNTETHELDFASDTRIPFDWLPGGAYIVLEWWTNPVHPERYVRRARLLALSCDPDTQPATKIDLTGPTGQ